MYQRTIKTIGRTTSLVALAAISLTLSAMPISALAVNLSLEAENGIVFKPAKVVNKSFMSGGKGVGNLGGNEDSRVQMRFRIPATGDYTVSIRYASGERRTLWMSINGNTPFSEQLYSGSWTRLATHTFQYHFGYGDNSLLLFNPDNKAPDIDRILITGGPATACSSSGGTVQVPVTTKLDVIEGGRFVSTSDKFSVYATYTRPSGALYSEQVYARFIPGGSPFVGSASRSSGEVLIEPGPLESRTFGSDATVFNPGHANFGEYEFFAAQGGDYCHGTFRDEATLFVQGVVPNANNCVGMATYQPGVFVPQRTMVQYQNHRWSCVGFSTCGTAAPGTNAQIWKDLGTCQIGAFPTVDIRNVTEGQHFTLAQAAALTVYVESSDTDGATQRTQLVVGRDCCGTGPVPARLIDTSAPYTFSLATVPFQASTFPVPLRISAVDNSGNVTTKIVNIVIDP